MNEVHRMYQVVPTIIKCLQNAETICGIHLPKETVFMVGDHVEAEDYSVACTGIDNVIDFLDSIVSHELHARIL